MFRLTVIIPFFKGTPTSAFEETLASVLLHRPEDVEVLVANGVGYRDPWNTAEDGVDFVSLKGRKNPIDLLNETVRRSEGEIVHFLYPGAEVSDGWTGEVLKSFESSDVGIVIPCVYDRHKSKRIFSLGVKYGGGGTLRTIRRSQWADASVKTIVPHISAVFFRKSCLVRAGLFNRSFLPQLAYADTALTIAGQHAKTVVEQSCRITVRPNQLPATLPFTWGIQIERLYFRWLGRHHSFRTAGKHFVSFFIDFWRHFPRLKAFQLLFGRCVGLLYFGEMRMAFLPVRDRRNDSKPSVLSLEEVREQNASANKKTA